MAMRVDWCVSSCGFVPRILTHSQPDAVIPCQERENYSSRGAQLKEARPGPRRPCRRPPGGTCPIAIHKRASFQESGSLICKVGTLSFSLVSPFQVLDLQACGLQGGTLSFSREMALHGHGHGGWAGVERLVLRFLSVSFSFPFPFSSLRLPRRPRVFFLSSSTSRCVWSRVNQAMRRRCGVWRCVCCAVWRCV